MELEDSENKEGMIGNEKKQNIGDGNNNAGVQPIEMEKENFANGKLASDSTSILEPSTSSKPALSEEVILNFVWGKQKHDISISLDATVQDLKVKVQTLTSVPPAMQKLMCKGMMKDGETLKESKVTPGSKVMLIGCTINDVMAVNTQPSKEDLKKEEKTSTTKEPLSMQKPHNKIIDKGIPEDAMPGVLNTPEHLPDRPISGMLNSKGGKIRLTFKLELDELWIGTKERTNKVPMGHIQDVISEPIKNYEHYHIMAIQLGPTEQSRLWIYWVPAQYVRAIKLAILGPGH